MRKKIIGIMLIILGCLLVFNIYKVEAAFSGELDPENYITLPSRINVKNGKGTGTITLSSSASSYSISYQKVDITASQFKSIQDKGKEINDYITANSNPTPENQSAVLARINTLKSEFYALLPNYTNSWKTTTNTSNNVELDFGTFTGTANFVLWVKIENGTNTYYDMDVYSTNISQTQTPEGSGSSESGIKFKLKKDEGTALAFVEVSNLTKNEGSYYNLFITANSSKPNVTYSSDEAIFLEYDSNSKTFKSGNVSKYVELNQDLYATIIEKKANYTEEMITFGNKLERYEEPKYANAFHATHMVENYTQLVTLFTHSSENPRKMQIKIGKITDTSILQKIKSQDSSGFAGLLSFAKTNNGIYDKVFEANNESFIEYISSTTEGKQVINLTGLQNDAYYFLYIKTLDEDGKYISQEAVTLAQASVRSDYWGMFFYGSDDFKWADFGTGNTGKVPDGTTAPGKLPQTGINTIIYGTLSLILISGATIYYIQYRKNNF